MSEQSTLPKRKSPRLQGYDYSQPGLYFVTLCTYGKRKLFGDVGADSISARLIRDAWHETMARYPGVSGEHFVVMPNHAHGIVEIQQMETGSAPTLSAVIQAFKRLSTFRYIQRVKSGQLPFFEKHIWQRSFHDHVIRVAKDHLRIWEYIENNPLKWELDCFYVP